MKEEQFKPIDQEIKIKPTIIKLQAPNNKPSNEQNDNIIVELPTWNIEPPIEIKRGK